MHAKHHTAYFSQQSQSPFLHTSLSQHEEEVQGTDRSPEFSQQSALSQHDFSAQHVETQQSSDFIHVSQVQLFCSPIAVKEIAPKYIYSTHVPPQNLEG